MQTGRQRNPYKVLQIPRDADDAAIEEAYDTLFDHYEPTAHSGDESAIQALEELNSARDTLLDPVLRAEIDARLSRTGGQGNGQRAAGAVMSAASPARGNMLTKPGQTGEMGPQTAGPKRRGSGSNRPRSVERQQTARSPMPWIIGGFFALVAVAVIIFLISKNLNGGTGQNGVSTDTGPVVATVNGQPIYQRELDARYEKDKGVQLAEPLIQGIMAEGGITATRVLEVIKQDALDKLINLEVIKQQAKKEQLYPDAAAQKQMIDQAKASDVKPGETFEQSLLAHGLTEEQYNHNVVSDIVYRVMASKHMPATGSDQIRQDAFITWICTTRKSYDVKIMVAFPNSQDNKECSSGLPSDIQLTTDQVPPTPADSGTPSAPGAEPTQQAPLVPKATQGKP